MSEVSYELDDLNEECLKMVEGDTFESYICSMKREILKDYIIF